MARFRFSMENILNMKEKLEEQAKNEYGLANARLLQEQDKLDALIDRREGARQRLEQVLHETLSVLEIKKREDALEIIKMYVMQQQFVVKRCEKELEIARDKMSKAMQERKIFEKLKEKAFEKFMREKNQKEQKEVDELMSYKYGTRRKNA